MSTPAIIPAGGRVWTDSPLYLYLVEILPAYRSDHNSLQVGRLSDAIGLSRERVYQCLRKSRMTPANARKICALSHSKPNTEALDRLGRTPPEIHEFNRFVYGDD